MFPVYAIAEAYLPIDVYLINTMGDGMQTRIRRYVIGLDISPVHCTHLITRSCRREEIGSREVHLSMTVRHPEVDGQRVETRRILTMREYETLRAQADPSRAIIKKRRRCFLHNDRYFQLDVYQHPNAGLVLLETYLDFDFHNPSVPVSQESIQSRLPEWLELEEVTGNKQYSMYTIAESAPLDRALAKKLSRYDLTRDA